MLVTDFPSFNKYWQYFHTCVSFSPEGQHVITKQVAEEHTTNYTGVYVSKLNYSISPNTQIQ